jgi:acyl CoA:acetate/3-ketoacid CoA transferase beta subunit
LPSLTRRQGASPGLFNEIKHHVIYCRAQVVDGFAEKHRHRWRNLPDRFDRGIDAPVDISHVFERVVGDGSLVLRETAPGVSVDQVRAETGATLTVADDLITHPDGATT